MNIDHASSSTFPRTATSESRVRSFLFALVLSAFALVALLVTVVLLFLSARAQMQFQVSPTDIKYGPVQRIPAATPDSRATANSEDDDDDSDSAPAQPGAYGAGIIPGIPGISGGPLFPSSPQAPSYTPAPAAPSRTEPPQAGRSAPVKVAPDTTPAPAATADPVTRPRNSARHEGTPVDTGRIRRVGNKSFKRDGTGTLVDTAYDSNAGLEIVTVVAGSDAYVRLLEARQDLRQFFRLDDRLIVVVDNIVYRVVPKD